MNEVLPHKGIKLILKISRSSVYGGEKAAYILKNIWETFNTFGTKNNTSPTSTKP